jgi:PAS domain S-box-containing protein
MTQPANSNEGAPFRHHRVEQAPGVPGAPARCPVFTAGPIMQAASEAIICVDDAQRIVMINPAAQRMFGCTAAEVLGQNLARFIPLRHRKAHALHVRQFAQSGTAERPMNERGPLSGLRANGEEFPIEATIARVDVADAQGMRSLFTVLLRDLSEVTRLQHEVAGLQRDLKAIFEMAPAATCIVDGETIVFANRACAALFNHASHEAMLGRSIYEVLGPQSRPTVGLVVAQAMTRGQPVSAQNERIVLVDGTVRHVDIGVAALPDHGQRVVQMVIADVTARHEENRELETSRRQLRELSASLVHAREEERRRIARELHDELGQRLTALHMELSSLQATTRSKPARDRMQAMLHMVDDTAASVRRISTDLRPLMLDDLGLNAAIEWLCHSWEQRMGIRTRLQLDKDDPAIGEHAVTGIYRMVQEALTNVARHARATRVDIRLQQTGDTVELTVQDNGTGFPDPLVQGNGSYGLMGIRERASLLGGQLEIGNAPSGGARITVRLPCTASDRSATPRSQSESGPAARPADPSQAGGTTP